MSTATDSFWKPPVLNPGEYAWWKDQFEAHVCSLDEKLWRVFEKGNVPILDVTDPANPKEKEKDKYTDVDYKSLQQNARAKKVLFMALSPGDQVKMNVYKTTKEQWDGLARLYEGNEDIKRNRILATMKDYETVEQRKDKSLEDFYTRFQLIVAQLNSLEEKLPQWKITHQFMQALSSR
ncbi:unnamed protein product [Rhodiola kirilowii]